MEDLSIALQDYKDSDDQIIEILNYYALFLDALATQETGSVKTTMVSEALSDLVTQLDAVTEILENRINLVQPLLPLVRQSTYQERLQVELDRFLEKIKTQENL